MSKPILGIIGGGQLGSMLAIAANKLEIKTVVFCDDIDAPAQNFSNNFVQGQYNDQTRIKEFLNKLSKHISKGASFNAFAKLHSQHPSYVNGGTTDWIEVNNPTLEMLDSLKANEVSKIYLTDFGFAIAIKLEERFVSSNLKKCKEKLIYLRAEKFYSNWVEGLRGEAYIKIYHDLL